MTFTIRKASDYKFSSTIDIETLDQLRELYDYYGKNEVIVNFDEMTIIIYDDYLE